MVNPVNIHDVGEIERAVATFARSANGGLIVTESALAVVHRDLIVTLAVRHKLPALYYDRIFVTAGGLISYRSSLLDNCRRVAGAQPVIIFLSGPSEAGGYAASRRSLSEERYVEGRNVGILYRYGEFQKERLPSLAADLTRDPVAARRSI